MADDTQTSSNESASTPQGGVTVGGQAVVGGDVSGCDKIVAGGHVIQAAALSRDGTLVALGSKV